MFGKTTSKNSLTTCDHNCRRLEINRPPITSDQVWATIRLMTEGKSPRPNNCHSEYLKLIAFTKQVAFCKNYVPQDNLITNNNQHIRRVSKYTYLGTELIDQWKRSQEIRCRIEKTRSIFIRMAPVFKNSSRNIDSKIKLMRFCLLRPTLWSRVLDLKRSNQQKKITAF